MIVSRKYIAQLSTRFLPFSDAASDDLPLKQLLRLALFQVSVGMAGVMLLGTLVVLPLLFGASDAGLDTVEEGGTVGFQDVTDPSQYQPDSMSLPGKLQLGMYVLGIAAYSAIGLAVTM